VACIKPFSSHKNSTIMALSIPAFHVSGKSKAKGKAQVFIASRQDAASAGTFELKIDVQFDPAVNPYPTGAFELRTDMSDGLKGVFVCSTIELINSYGKHNPTIFLTGQCKVDPAGDEKAPKGCRYWLMIANNKRPNPAQGTPDIIGFAIHDSTGNRVAYGIGPVRQGDMEVLAPGN
jgi:hypothetical protein